MKKITQILAAGILSATILNSCSKNEDQGLLPQIAFLTGTGYTSADDTVGTSTTLVTGIHAKKSEPLDVLKTLSVTVSYDGAPDSTVFTYTIPTSSQDSFDMDYLITTRPVTGTELYKYTVVNRDGLVNTIQLMLTVQ